VHGLVGGDMHNATTKQRLAALRRKLGMFASTPRWVKEGRARRLARLEAALARALPADAGAATETDGAAGLFAALAASLPPAEARVSGDADAAPPSAFSPDPGPVDPAPRDSVLPASPGGAGAGATAPMTAAWAAPAWPRRSADSSLATTEIERRERPAPRRARRAFGGFAIAGIAAAAALLLALRSRAPAPGTTGSPAADPSSPTAAASPSAASPAVPAPPVRVAPAPAAAARAEAGELEVRPGDTLWELSARHLGAPRAWPQLHAANRDAVRDPDLIYPGQRLRVPTP
jgi:resuscitation-promoting factor RpfA